MLAHDDFIPAVDNKETFSSNTERVLYLTKTSFCNAVTSSCVGEDQAFITVGSISSVRSTIARWSD